MIGDGEAETGPLAASWHSNKFLNAGARRRGAAGAAPQRLQDRQPDRARADPRRGAARAARGLRLRAPLRRGLRSGGDAPADGGDARRGRRRDRRDPAARARGRRDRAAALADDRAADAEGMDRPEGGRRPPRRGIVPLAPGAARRGPHPPRASGGARGWMRSYRPARALRRERRAARPDRRARARGRAADGREPARQRRAAAARPRAARTSAPTPWRSMRRVRSGRVNAGARRVPARRDAREPGQLPADGAGRDRVEPARARCSR